MKYIALLRGVNVGGKNKVSMQLLKKAFEEAGFAQVRTYINSGNIIFTDDSENTDELKHKCERIIKERFRLEIPVVIVRGTELEDMLMHAPDWWSKDKEDKHNAIFVIPPATAEEVISAVGEIKPEYESIAHYNNLIYWTAPMGTFSKTRWAKISSLPVYSNVTIRNSNTVKKLLELVK